MLVSMKVRKPCYISFERNSVTDRELESAIKKNLSFNIPVGGIITCCTSIEDELEKQKEKIEDYNVHSELDGSALNNVNKYKSTYNTGIETLVGLRNTLFKIAPDAKLGYSYEESIKGEYRKLAEGGKKWAENVLTALNKTPLSQKSNTQKIDIKKNLTVYSETDGYKKWMESIAGMDPLKDKLWTKILSPLAYPDPDYDFPPSGILLYGPDGCGKSYIAKKMAEFLSCEVFEMSVGRQGETFINGTSKNIINAFEEARQSARKNRISIVFFDEADSLMTSIADLPNSANYRRDDVNTIKQEIEKSVNEGVFIIASTNHPLNLDKAATRSGRISYKFLVDLPDIKTRKAILKEYLNKKKPGKELASNEEELNKISAELEGFTNADIAEAIINSVFQEAKPTRSKISRKHFDAVLKMQEIKTLRKDREEEWKYYGIDKMLKTDNKNWNLGNTSLN